MSPELMQKIKLSYQQLLIQRRVGIAKGGALLDKIGIMKPFNIKIRGNKKDLPELNHGV